MMKIAFYVYPVAFQSPGGGEILLLKTKEYLEKEGVNVKLFDPWHDQLTDFDLLHTFGSVKDSLRMMQVAKSRGVKNVLSTICYYSWKSAWGTSPDLKSKIPAVIRHAAKEMMPWLPSERKAMMEIADQLLPNSQKEAGQLKRYFQIPSNKIRIIYNGVDESFQEATPDLFHESYPHRDFILCVGRIEPRKNQLRVIRALKDQSIPVVFIGDYVYSYGDYYEQCKREAGPHMHFLGGMPHDSELLKSAYAACNTFLLATWLETPGLAALEAGLAGSKVVITGEGSTREYFQDYVTYVQPGDIQDIREKTTAVYQQNKTAELSNHIRNHFTWKQVARVNLEVYRDLLK